MKNSFEFSLMTMEKIFFISFFVCAFLEITSGLRCYTCSYDERDWQSSYLCVTEPWNLTGTPIRTCLPHFKYCIIIRIESKERGKVTSFLRKCEENPTEDSDVESESVVAHYRSCSSNLCNSGDGLNFIDEGHEEESVAILVPDRSWAGRVFPKISVLVLSFVYLLWNR